MRFVYNKYSIFCIIIAIIFSNDIFSQSPAKDNYNKAIELYNDFKYFEATGYLQKALKVNPYYTQAQILLADCFLELQNYTAAWETYLKAEKKDPNNPELLVKLAKTKLKMASSREDIAATEIYLIKAYQLAPRNPEVALLYGEFYMKMNEYQKALDYYNDLGSVDNPEIYINKARIYESWGQYEKALDELKKGEKINSQDYKLLLETGKVYTMLKQPEKALVYLNTAYSYNPTDRDTLQALANLYIGEKDFAEASEKIGELIIHDKANSVLYYDLALCYEQLGDYPKAVEILLEGLKYDYGNEFLRIKAEEMSVSKIPLSNKNRIDLAAFYKVEGKNLLKINKIQEALFFLKRALRINPLDIETRMSIANTYRQKAYLYEYLSLLKGGVFLNPSNIDLKDQLLLNQKFIMNSLEKKENLTPKPFIPLEPVLYIKDIDVTDPRYSYFSDNAREVFLEALINNHSLNVVTELTPDGEQPQFNIQMRITPSAERLDISVDIIYIATGSTYLSYSLTEYGNNRMLRAFQEITSNIERDMPKIGHILKIDGNIAIINMGAQQGITKGQKMRILNNPELPNKFFSTNIIDPSWEIATAEVVELGENISKIQFKPLDRLIFNMVQQNQSIIIEQRGKK